MGGACFGVVGIAVTSFAEASSQSDRLPWLFYVIFLYWICRPWFMGVVIMEDAIQIRSWYRTYRIPYTEIAAVGYTRYQGLMAKTAVGWLPVAGVIATIEIRTTSGRCRDFPSTVGRLRTVLKLRRSIREAARLAPPRFDLNDPDTL